MFLNSIMNYQEVRKKNVRMVNLKYGSFFFFFYFGKETMNCINTKWTLTTKGATKEKGCKN